MVDRWAVERRDFGAVRVAHVLPINDLHEHVEYGDGCWCRPRVERHEHGRELTILVTHSAADGRELIERHRVN
jgi:hypothetical protein